MKSISNGCRILFLFLVSMIFCIGCSRSDQTYDPQSEENQMAHSEAVASNEIMPEEREGLVIWRFSAPKNTELPALKIGMVCTSFAEATEFQEILNTANEYLREHGACQLEIVVVQWIQTDKGGAAVQVCLDEGVDILACAGTDRSDIPLEKMVDLGQESYREQLAPLFSIFPKPYWEFIQKQLGGIYSVSASYTFYGGDMCLSMEWNEETGQIGLEGPTGFVWDAEAALGYTWEEWETQFEEWNRLYAEEDNVCIMDIYSSQGILNYLAAETECQEIAPGIGIDLQSGEVVRILDLPEIQNRIERYQGFIDQGMVREAVDEVPIVTSFKGSSLGTAAASSRKSGITQGLVSWTYAIQDKGKPPYFPISWNYGLSFTGVLQESSHISVALQFLNQVGQDKALRDLLWAEQANMSHLLEILWHLDRYNESKSENTFYYEDHEADYLTYFYTAYETAEFSPVTGFYFDPAPVQTEIEALERVFAASPATRQVSQGSVYNNATFTEDFETLRAELENAGIELVYAEVERQLAQWSALQE